ncbi:MAG TPA: phage major capsid protein [Negativicutes bacterium]|nr:phage major capsid protein [Negativicutes bacterium]
MTKMNLQLFAMKNLDLLQQQKLETFKKINQAVKDGNEEAFTQAFTEYTDLLQEAVMAEAKGLIQAADNQILAGRGARALTSEETKYYQSVIDAMKSKDPKQALTSLDLTLPETVIDSVFEDIVEDHPLLDAINFTPTGALVEIIVSTMDGRQLATWGKLCDDIIKELSAGFSTINLSQKKLTAFLPICKAMLDLGPTWIDRYVRAHLSEAIYNGLENGIIDGSGIDSPIGMRRNPNSALDPVSGYGLQPLIPLNEINPNTYGALISQLSVAPTGLQRSIKQVMFIVSPKDYFTKIFAATTYQQQDGSYINNIFPFPTRLIQSVYVPEGEAIIGLGSRYFMGLGTGKGGKVEYSDEYRFLEDERMYLTKLYGDGKPLDNASFIRLDIRELRQSHPVVRTIPYADATLSGIKIANGTIELSPKFDRDIHYYSAGTANSADLVTVVATDANAVITATLNGAATNLGNNQNWIEGKNVLVITVTNGDIVETYVLVVTHPMV